MQPTGQGGAPEAVTYRADDGAVGFACAECDTIDSSPEWDKGEAMLAAQDHLWRHHGKRRVWVDDVDRSTAVAVQLALPILVGARGRLNEAAARAGRG